MTEPQIWTIIGVGAAALLGIITIVSTSFTRVLRTELGAIREVMDTRFGEIDRRFGDIDRRLDRMDQRFDRMDERLDRMDERLGRLEKRIDDIDRDVQTLTRREFREE